MKNEIKTLYARHLRNQVTNNFGFEVYLLEKYPDLYKSSTISLEQYRKNLSEIIGDVLNLSSDIDKLDETIKELEIHFEISQEIIKEIFFSTQNK
jgi:hypothetical protein